MMLRKIALSFLFAGFVLLLSGQNTGYLGKKFLIKTNLFNGRFFGFSNADVEYVVGRQSSIIVSAQHFDYGVGGGRKAKTGSVSPGNNRGKLWEISTLKNGRTTGNLVSFGYRHYFDRIIPAPYGYYFECSVGFGEATFSDYYVSYTYKKVRGKYEVYPRADSPTLSGRSKIVFFELPSFGYQKVINRFITFDAKISLQGQYCNLPQDMRAAIDHNLFVSSNTVNLAYNGLSIGPSVFIKLGILVF